MSAPTAGWLEAREKGGVLGIRLVTWLATAFGRGPARAVVSLVCAYYVLLHRDVRRASGAYLARINERVTLGMIYRHVRTFGHVALDRLFLLRGRNDLFAIESHGTERLREAREAGRGAVLLGAHLGSFEALRAMGAKREYPIHIVGYFRNARMINAALQAASPGTLTRVIEVDPDHVRFALRLKELIARGEFVAILADRVGLNARTVTADFLGAPAPFPAGPFLLAAALRCPVLLTLGIFREPDRYDLHCEPFADPLTLARGQRDADLAAHVQRYAARVEHHCRLAPDNWFNFYDFWRGGAEPASPPTETPG